MSLENEYYTLKQELKMETKKLKKFEALNSSDMNYEQLEARDKGIKSVKENIGELEESIKEVKEELKEFIENGGECSEKTKEEVCSENGVNFEIISKNNQKINIIGELDLNTIDDDEPDYNFEQNDGTYDSYLPTYFKLNGEDLSDEFEEFKGIIFSEWDIIEQYLWDYQNENIIVEKTDYFLVINDDGKLELIAEEDEFFGDTHYNVTLSFKYNNKIIEWDDEILCCLGRNINNIYGGEEDDFSRLNDTSIEIEVGREGLSGDNPESQELINEILIDVGERYKQQLILNLGVYGEAYNQIRDMFRKTDDVRALNEGLIDNLARGIEESWESYEIKELYIMSDEIVEKLIKEDVNGLYLGE